MLSDYLNQQQSKLVCNYKKITKIGRSPHFQWVSQLYISNNNLQTLEGLEQFHYLQILSIHHNQITSIKELDRIKPQGLTRLSVKMNPFTNNPLHMTLILQKFPHLETIDDFQLVPNIRYQYFNWLEQISSNLVHAFIQRINIDEIKPSQHIYEINDILTKLVCRTYALEDEHEFRTNSKILFEKILAQLKSVNRNQLYDCLIAICQQDLTTDAYLFAQNTEYLKDQMYKVFLGLQVKQRFRFPYFPLNQDYVNAIIKVLRHQYKSQRLVFQKEIQVETVETQQPSFQQQNQSQIQIIPQLQIDTKELSQQININVVKGTINIDALLNKIINQQSKIMKNEFLIMLKLNYGLGRLTCIQKLKRVQFLRLGLNFLKSLSFQDQSQQMTRYSRNQSTKSVNVGQSLNNRSQSRIFNASQYNPSQYNPTVESQTFDNDHTKRAMLYQLISKRFESLNSINSRMENKLKLYYLKLWRYKNQTNNDDKTFNQVFGNKSQHQVFGSKTSLSTKVPKQCSIYQQKSQSDFQNQPSERIEKQSILKQLDNQGTKIFCEYVIINNDKKKKKKKTKKSNISVKKTKKKTNCQVCREYMPMIS